MPLKKDFRLQKATEQGSSPGITAKDRDILLHPAQCEDAIQIDPVVISFADGGEIEATQSAEATVDGNKAGPAACGRSAHCRAL